MPMLDDQCRHGLVREGCASCAPVAAPVPVPAAKPSSSRTKQLRLDELCDLLGVARFAATPGSSPRRVFDAAAARARVDPGPMPAVGAAIATKAGLAWGPECDNRRHHQDATMVTTVGLSVITRALGILARA